MKTSRTLVATFLAFGIAAATVGAAVAQSTQGGTGQTQPGMMQGGMGGMGPGMMMGGMGLGTTALFVERVTPMMNLSVNDARSYLDAQRERLDNKRLEVGDVKADGGTVTTDIVTVDNSLVQRPKVDRRTGAIEYQK